jgi:hypothetical protein
MHAQDQHPMCTLTAHHQCPHHRPHHHYFTTLRLQLKGQGHGRKGKGGFGNAFLYVLICLYYVAEHLTTALLISVAFLITLILAV